MECLEQAVGAGGNVWMDQHHLGSPAGPCRFALETAAGLVNITRKAINKRGRDDFSLDLFKSSH